MFCCKIVRRLAIVLFVDSQPEISATVFPRTSFYKTDPAKNPMHHCHRSPTPPPPSPHTFAALRRGLDSPFKLLRPSQSPHTCTASTRRSSASSTPHVRSMLRLICRPRAHALCNRAHARACGRLAGPGVHTHINKLETPTPSALSPLPLAAWLIRCRPSPRACLLPALWTALRRRAAPRGPCGGCCPAFSRTTL